MADLSEIEKSRRVIEGPNGTDLIINDDGTASVKNPVLVSSKNSSTTLLGSNGIFTGTSEDLLSFGMVTVSVFSDQASATDGLSIEFSSDQTNWDNKDVFTIPANTGKVFTIQRVARFFRIVYTNGSIAQTVFRLHTILDPFAAKASTHRIQDSISTDDDAELVKSVITAQSSITTNLFENIKQREGRLLVSQEPVAPSGSTSVEEVEFGDVASTSGVDNEHLIPNGKELTIQQLSAGAEESVGGSIVELFEDPNGDKSVLNRIDQIFINGNSFQLEISKKFTGDGTKRIIMRRRGYSGSAREMSAKWIGFEE